MKIPTPAHFQFSHVLTAEKTNAMRSSQLLLSSLHTNYRNRFKLLLRLFMALLLLAGLLYLHAKYRSSYDRQGNPASLARLFCGYHSTVTARHAASEVLPELSTNSGSVIASAAGNTLVESALRSVDEKLQRERRQMVLFSDLTGQVFHWDLKNPKRILLVTSWRSGSTFLGMILSNHSAAFNWYEPLMHLLQYQVEETGSKADEAVEQIKSLLHCRFPKAYVDYVGFSTFDMLSRNQGIWDSCQEASQDLSVCYSPGFLERSCLKFPIQVMKLVRLRVSLAERLLSDPAFPGLKLIHLVRDPRAVMNSRWQLEWCNASVDCYETKKYCNYTGNDLKAFDRLKSIYPDRVLQVRYENMASKPLTTIRKIFSFTGLQFTKNIQRIIIESTTRDEDFTPWGTTKISYERIDMWKRVLDNSSIANIEKTCVNVMKKLGYKFINKLT